MPQVTEITPEIVSKWELVFPITKVVPASVELSLYALSYIVDNIESINKAEDVNSQSIRSDNSKSHAVTVVDEIASMPS